LGTNTDFTYAVDDISVAKVIERAICDAMVLLSIARSVSF